jgi:hypothetical protein
MHAIQECRFDGMIENATRIMLLEKNVVGHLVERAVRSGYLAAEALDHAAGRDARFLVPDLSSSGFMRLFA